MRLPRGCAPVRYAGRIVEQSSPSERRHVLPVSEGYDRAAVDAYLRQLATEVETLTRMSGELHERARVLGGELNTLTESLRAGTPAAACVEPPSAATTIEVSSSVPATHGEQDLDGARLVALNMALEGQPRERTDAYLAERFQLGDRAKLLDEVYAAVDG